MKIWKPDKSNRGRPRFWVRALFGGLVGMGFLRVYQYFCDWAGE